MMVSTKATPTDMQTPPTTSQLFLTRVTQGVMLGTVLAVPVALWAYTQAAPPPAEEPTIAQQVKTVSAKRASSATPARKPMRVVKDAPTIPASQMHLRIDDGRRSQPQSQPQDTSAVN